MKLALLFNFKMAHQDKKRKPFESNFMVQWEKDIPNPTTILGTSISGGTPVHLGSSWVMLLALW